MEFVGKMDQEVKTKFLEALRSGKYKQGTQRLRSEDDCYCVAGVLCDVIDPNGWIAKEGRDYSHCKVGDTAYPSDNIVAAAGLEDAFYRSEGPYQFQEAIIWYLIMLNDRDNKTFPEIADWIEVNL